MFRVKRRKLQEANLFLFPAKVWEYGARLTPGILNKTQTQQARREIPIALILKIDKNDPSELLKTKTRPGKFGEPSSFRLGLDKALWNPEL